MTNPDTVQITYRSPNVDGEATLAATFVGNTAHISDDAGLALDQPVALSPVRIDKPWGAEVWYTGMEARGESRVRAGDQTLRLSAYLALLEAHTGARLPTPLLLKILDPSPEPVTGDLYFEVHQQKQEVYIVTRVDPTAWPDGHGGIRFGMNQDKRGAFENDDAFRAAYLAAVEGYEAVRRAIDSGQSDVATQEADLREEMDSFTALAPLSVGDVVRVPTWTPHALQHGVQVVEFQTQTYERFILSFAQRVLTQDHWDTAKALPKVNLEPPAAPQFEHVAPGVERIARFEDFNVWRVTLDAANGANLQLPNHLPYAVIYAISGDTCLMGEQVLEPGNAYFVPAAALPHPLMSQNSMTLLIAAPNL